MSIHYRSPDGESLANWHGYVVIRRTRCWVDLDVLVTGSPPLTHSPQDRGDVFFEASRLAALSAHAAVTARAEGNVAVPRMHSVPGLAILLGVPSVRIEV